MIKKLLFLLIAVSTLSIQAQEKAYNCFFQLNSAKYHSDSISKLQSWLHSNSTPQTVTLELVAYTDTIGSIEYNDRLANKRLENIAEILKSKGYEIKDSRTIGKRYTTNHYSNNADFRKVEVHLIQNSIEPILEELEGDSIVEIKEEEIKKEVMAPRKVEIQSPERNRLEEFEALGNNKVINLNIEFKNNTSVYKNKESEKQVYYLAEYLKKYPKKKVMILGHVCCSNNYAVSTSRAKKVYEDLVKYNINKKRMKYKGMSNTIPLVEEVNATTEQQNRRVEVMFYEK